MFVAGIDAHATYLVVAVVSKDGRSLRSRSASGNTEPDRLVELLSAYRPLEVVVEASPSWSWLCDLLNGPDCRFVLAHAKKLLSTVGEWGTPANLEIAIAIPMSFFASAGSVIRGGLVEHRGKLLIDWNTAESPSPDRAGRPLKCPRTSLIPRDRSQHHPPFPFPVMLSRGRFLPCPIAPLRCGSGVSGLTMGATHFRLKPRRDRVASQETVE